MPPVGFEPTISAGGRPEIYALDRAATGTFVTLQPQSRSSAILQARCCQTCGRHLLSVASYHDIGFRLSRTLGTRDHESDTISCPTVVATQWFLFPEDDVGTLTHIRSLRWMFPLLSKSVTALAM